VVQARTGSTRLPRKALLPLGDSTVLVEMVRRVATARHAGEIVIATTTDPADDEIERLAVRHGFACFRGHPTDLLDRHYRAMRAFGADAVVKIPSDCPLIDPGAIDRVIGRYLRDPDRYDYLSNLHPQSYPDGNDVEVMRASALEQAWREATRGIDREHTTPYFWDEPGRFRVGNVEWETGQDLSRSHRWTLDYAEDYQLIRAVHEALAPGDPFFGAAAIVSLLAVRPDLYELNARYRGDSWYQRHRHELKTWRLTDAGP
jgi:spore coat polysaccharide biosynthesis protein SpsF